MDTQQQRSLTGGTGVVQAVAFLRPTLDNFTLLRRHLRNPKYGEYHLCTSQARPPLRERDREREGGRAHSAHPSLCACVHRWRSQASRPHPNLSLNPSVGLPHSVFSNMVRDAFLHELAEVDTHDLVKQVHEYFADFVPLDGAHFTLPVYIPRTTHTHTHSHRHSAASPSAISMQRLSKKRMYALRGETACDGF